MRLSVSDILFVVCFGSVSGIVFRVYEVPFLFVFPVCLLACCIALFAILFFEERRAVLCLLALGSVCLGFGYAQLRMGEHHELSYGETRVILGTVRSYPRLSDYGKGFILKTDEGNLQIYVPFAREVAYGDSFVLRGVVEELSETQTYLKKDFIRGVVRDPFVTAHVVGDASLVRSLYDLRRALRDVFVKLLPYDGASLAVGLLIGGGSISFSQDLRDVMRNSGTTHIVALSGYNVSMIVLWVFVICGFFLKRRTAFWSAACFIMFFTIMTGMEVSMFRAACMGFLFISAQYLGRVYHFRQSTALVCLAMLVVNPLAIRYDAGFVLSFLSLLGIVYIAPLMVGFVRWKILAETLCAQLAVLPVLVSLFGGFSPLGLFANLLILPVVPFAMVGSFCAGLAGLVALPLGHLLSLALEPLLAWMLWVIRLFGGIDQLPMRGSFFLAGVYYGLLIGLCVYIHRKRSCFGSYISY